MANKLINKLISYQDYDKIIINLSNESTDNQQIMNIGTYYLSKTWKCSSTHEEHYTIDLDSKSFLFQNNKQ